MRTMENEDSRFLKLEEDDSSLRSSATVSLQQLLLIAPFVTLQSVYTRRTWRSGRSPSAAFVGAAPRLTGQEKVRGRRSQAFAEQR